MPSREAHELDAELRGYDPKVNQAIDLPFAWLGGRHRILFHKPYEAMMIGAALDGPQGALGGIGHVYLDMLCSRNKQAREIIEFLANLRRKKKKGIQIVGSKPTFKIISP